MNRRELFKRIGAVIGIAALGSRFSDGGIVPGAAVAPLPPLPGETIIPAAEAARFEEHIRDIRSGAIHHFDCRCTIDTSEMRSLLQAHSADIARIVREAEERRIA